MRNRKKQHVAQPLDFSDHQYADFDLMTASQIPLDRKGCGLYTTREVNDERIIACVPAAVMLSVLCNAGSCGHRNRSHLCSRA